jgi:hypothetical protein
LSEETPIPALRDGVSRSTQRPAACPNCDEIPGQSIGTIIDAYPTIAAAFAGNEAFQA